MSSESKKFDGPDDDEDGFWVDEKTGVWYSARDKTEVFFGAGGEEQTDD